MVQQAPGPLPPSGGGDAPKPDVRDLITLMQQLQSGTISPLEFKSRLSAVLTGMGFDAKTAVPDILKQLGISDADLELPGVTAGADESLQGPPPIGGDAGGLFRDLGDPPPFQALGADSGGFDPSGNPQDALQEALSRSQAFDIFQSNRFPGAGQGLQRRAFGRRFGDFENLFTTRSAANAPNVLQGQENQTFSNFLQGNPNISGQGQREALLAALSGTQGASGISPRAGFLEGLSGDPTSQFGLAFGTLGLNRSNPFFGSIRNVARRRFNQQISQAGTDPLDFLPGFAEGGFRF